MNGNVGSSTVNVPQRIHSVMQDYLKYIHPLQLCHDLWDQADSMIADHHHPAQGVDAEIRITGMAYAGGGFVVLGHIFCR